MNTLPLARFSLTPRQRAYLINGLLLLALLISLWRWLEAIAPARVQYQRPVTEAVNNQPRSTTRVEVARLHLFGRHDARATAQALPPKSRLKLSLQGTLMATDRAQRRAFIADASGQQNSYAEQDKLPDGAKLLTIQQDHVVILHNGRKETLRMGKVRTAADPAPENATSLNAYRGGPLKQAPPIPGIRGTGTPRVAINNAQLSVAQLKLDPARLAQQVNAVPVRKNGKITGYRLRAGRYAAVLQRLGIRPQDVVTEINGQSLSDPSAALMLLGQLQQGGPVQLTIERDGQPQTVTIDLDTQG